MSFVHLHVHSYFSFYDSTAAIDPLLEQAKALGMPALALTDYNGVYGAVQFINRAEKLGIKPIIGAEIAVKGMGKLVLLARTSRGYANLCRILSKTMMKEPANPRFSAESISENARDIFALLGPPLGDRLEKGERKEADRVAGLCTEIFGKDSLIIELQNHGLPGDRERLRLLWNFAQTEGLLPVASNNVHLLSPNDYFVHQALIACARTVHHRDVQPRGNSEFHLKSGTQMARAFNGYGEALHNTELIAQECNLELSLDMARPPGWEMPDEMPASDYLRRVCYQRLNITFNKGRTQAARRLAVELDVIDKKGFSDYFLVVADLIRYARERGIRHSCRGSASGSLTAYLLGISTVNPLENGLLFERFLNPERIDIPDIDIDFDSKRRDEVIDYAMERYRGHAAMVATISRFRGRSAIREIGRAMGLSYEKLDELVKSFRYMSASKIREAIVSLPELRDSELKSAKYQKLLDVCSRIDKFPRHMSVHLGGVVISREPIAHYSPVQVSRKGWPVLSFDKIDIETLGLIKTDLLGLRMLSTIEEASKLIIKQGKPNSLEQLDTNDRRVYELLRSAETLGCFQVESPGMRSLLGQLQPEKPSDIISAISLFRPGPVQADMVSPYIARRTGKERYVLPHKNLIPILDETYGVVLFQEQVLKVAHKISGFSLGKGDLMRRAMKDPKSEKMQTLRDDFVSGAKRRGVDIQVAEDIFNQLLTLAAFGFNKAHACSFAKIVFQSAYLKVYHPAEFMIGVLNHLPGMYSERVLLHEARRFGVTIFKPDINRSSAGYALENGAIRIGLRSVRHMGPVNLGRILEERSKGIFVDMEDFRRRTRVNENLLTSLVLAGVFDSLCPSRRLLLMSLTEGVPASQFIFTDTKDFTIRQKVAYELKHIGLDLTAHLVSLYREKLMQMGVRRCAELSKFDDGQKVSVAGMKILLHTPPTRSGIRVVFITLEDETGVLDVTVFPDTQERYGPTLFTSDLLVVEGTTRRMGDSISVNAERILNLQNTLTEKADGPQTSVA
jgi:error-prone DNA polymerase